MAYHNDIFPTDIAYGSVGGPEFSTEVIVLSNKSEKRNQNWTYPRETWDVAYGVKAKADLDDLINFFYAREGMAHSFRFKNHADFEATSTIIGLGDGADTTFQCVKQYISGGISFERKITKPILSGFQAYVSGSPVTAFANETTGIITFQVAPGNGLVLTADYSFYVQMRFDSDSLPVNLASYLAEEATVPLLEVDES